MGGAFRAVPPPNVRGGFRSASGKCLRRSTASGAKGFCSARVGLRLATGTVLTVRLTAFSPGSCAAAFRGCLRVVVGSVVPRFDLFLAGIMPPLRGADEDTGSLAKCSMGIIPAIIHRSKVTVPSGGFIATHRQRPANRRLHRAVGVFTDQSLFREPGERFLLRA